VLVTAKLALVQHDYRWGAKSVHGACSSTGEGRGISFDFDEQTCTMNTIAAIEGGRAAYEGI
jgi:predicted DsbA family dithiol-disulfide isomerase